ncbi:SpoIIE family protein phosphatase [Vallitalea pronyensis]|uniref:SpoIIE family protein phosphatase n=1 Tax=Vallitalea pronyensis TaxID=1348613 RepID=A0A8J8MJ76_9FIRM|nr:SpoIIE family protein phosphatase [Vallitalea pronyensis]QUI22640.1 SpoIIE family protein phosphatase [Vallitalea pronyensis]
MKHFIDIFHHSINKFGEQLCGDKVEVIRTNDSVIAVLSDGLGSGVKANILATLTAKIAATMLKEGASIKDTVDTIVNTLPECSVRKLAYSTFTMIKIDQTGKVYIAEYDNPPILIYRNGRDLPLNKQKIDINGKTILESHFKLKVGDNISVISDGAVHAGVGALLNLGWQWDNINDYLRDLSKVEKTSRSVSGHFIGVCNNLYDDHPGDDTTIMNIKVRHIETIDLFTGPPEDRDMDSWIIRKLIKNEGKKIICGGTTANIASRELERDIYVDIDTMSKEVPPMAYMDGIDLVTEGVLTLKQTLEFIKTYAQDDFVANTNYLLTNNGASRLANMLINECTHIHFWVGKAVNPAHQNPNFPTSLNIKLQIVGDLVLELENIGKQVTVTYI